MMQRKGWTWILLPTQVGRQHGDVKDRFKGLWDVSRSRTELLFMLHLLHMTADLQDLLLGAWNTLLICIDHQILDGTEVRTNFFLGGMLSSYIMNARRSIKLPE